MKSGSKEKNVIYFQTQANNRENQNPSLNIFPHENQLLGSNER